MVSNFNQHLFPLWKKWYESLLSAYSKISINIFFCFVLLLCLLFREEECVYFAYGSLHKHVALCSYSIIHMYVYTTDIL